MGAAGRAVKEESVKPMNKVTPIDAEMLARFEQGYAARPELQVMSNAISRTALPDAAFVPAAAARLQMDFSVLVQTSNITNQKQSGRCWMFSTLNVLREQGHPAVQTGGFLHLVHLSGLLRQAGKGKPLL